MNAGRTGDRDIDREDADLAWLRRELDFVRRDLETSSRLHTDSNLRFEDMYKWRSSIDTEYAVLKNNMEHMYEKIEGAVWFLKLVLGAVVTGFTGAFVIFVLKGGLTL